MADGSPDKGPDHVNFKLASTGEAIGIFTADGTLIDSVTFGPQALGQSEGRLPDGASTIVMLDPTPTAPNRAFQTAERDTDGDGLSDTWEITHGLDPRSAGDAEQDSDGDGSNNLAEFQAGTDPRDTASVLKIDRVRFEAGGISLCFEAAAGRAYVIESSPTLSERRWTVLREISAENQARLIEAAGLPTDMSGDERYFRIVLKISR